MPRIRSVKPEFFTHPEIAPLSIPARLLFLSLLTQADDEGRLYDQPRRICANAFAEGDKVNPERLIAELAEAGRIRRYSADGKACILVEHFRKHQRIDKPSSSNIPGPIREDSTTPPGGLDDSSRPEVEQGTGNREGNREQGVSAPSVADAPLSHLLADLIEANGSKRPPVTPKWATSEHRLASIDRRAPEEAEAVLRWSQADPFWRSNVLSMPKFREQYDRLRLQMTRGPTTRDRAQEIYDDAMGGGSGANGSGSGAGRAVAGSLPASATS